jgi:hypothetical protein
MDDRTDRRRKRTLSGRPPTVVALGILTAMPVAGVIWQYAHYLEGLSRLGYDVWYVEDNENWPAVGWDRSDTDPAPYAAEYIRQVLSPFGMDKRWVYRARHSDEAVYGATPGQLDRLLREAALIINLNGATTPREPYAGHERFIFLETDPTKIQIELHEGDAAAIQFLDAHAAWFSFGENIDAGDSLLPVDPRFRFIPTRQPVIIDHWASTAPLGDVYTTIASFRQNERPVKWEGRLHLWSKHEVFMKYIDLPERTGRRFELALDRYSHDPSDRAELEAAGWRVSDGFELSQDADAYRTFIATSRAEFTVAKPQYTFFRTGWFSDRSATYLAASRPVVTQDTGFGRVVPVGTGLHAFSTMDEALDAIERIERDPEGNRRAASEIAREFFDHEKVLGDLLAVMGLPRRAGPVSTPVG